MSERLEVMTGASAAEFSAVGAEGVGSAGIWVGVGVVAVTVVGMVSVDVSGSSVVMVWDADDSVDAVAIIGKLLNIYEYLIRAQSGHL